MNTTKRNILDNNIDFAVTIIKNFIKNTSNTSESKSDVINNFVKERITNLLLNASNDTHSEDDKRLCEEIKNNIDFDYLSKYGITNSVYLINAVREFLNDEEDIYSLDNDEIIKDHINTFIANYDEEKENIDNESEQIMKEADEELAQEQEKEESEKIEE